MRKRKCLIGAMLGVVGALVVSGTAIAGTPQSQTLQTTLSPKKQDNKAFGGVSLHNIIKTQYDDFSGSPAARETVFNFGKDIKFTTGNLPACSQASLNAATSVAAVNVTCGRSVVGTGFNEVNNRTGAFTAQNPVVLVAGGPTTLYVWTRIAGGLTLVLNGRYSGHSLDVTGLPNTPGTDLTNFDTTMTKKRTGKSSFYVSARCSKKKKWVVTETTTYYNGQSLSASSTQKCKQK